MTKSIGTKHDPEAAAIVVKELMSQFRRRSPANARILAEYNSQPPYSQEELLATHMSPWRVSAAAVPVNPNPNRVRCPLCRRINTVTLVTAAADKKAANTFRCSYDGCRGHEWTD